MVSSLISYSCSLCSASYKTNSGLWKHCQKNHNGQGGSQISNQGFRSDLQIYPALDIWKQLSPNLHTFQYGIQVLTLAYQKGLHLNPIPLLQITINESFQIPPWWNHLFTDLDFKQPRHRQTTFWSTTGQLSSNKLIQQKFERSLFMSDKSDFPAHLGQDLISAFSVKASDFGLNSCKYIINQDSQLGLPVEGQNPVFDTVISSAGFITELHYDGIWTANILIEVIGKKVLFIWPPTIYNCQIVQTFSYTDTKWLPSAIQNLEKGQMIILVPGNKVFLPIGSFHAVVSLTPSAISGYSVIHPNMFETCKVLFDWDIKCFQKFHHTKDAIKKKIDEYNIQVEFWKNHPHPIIQEIKPSIESLISSWNELKKSL